MSEREQIVDYIKRDRDLLLEESHQFADEGRNELARVYDRIAMHVTLLVASIERKEYERCMNI